MAIFAVLGALVCIVAIATEAVAGSKGPFAVRFTGEALHKIVMRHWWRLGGRGNGREKDGIDDSGGEVHFRLQFLLKKLCIMFVKDGI